MAEFREKVKLTCYVDERLRDALVQKSEEDHVSVTDLIAGLIANGMGLPDLAAVPKKRMGRAFGTKIKKKKGKPPAK